MSAAIDWLDVVKIAASSSILTSVLGWGLNHVFVYRAALKRDARHFALRLAIILERFSLNCASFISDNRLYSDSQGSAGARRLSLPKLEDYPTDTDWKTLDLTLVNRVMSLPNRILIADNAIAFWWDVVGEEDCMQTETDQKAGSCGFESWLTALALRKRYGIPSSNLLELSWNFVETLKEQKAFDEARQLSASQDAAAAKTAA